MIEPGTLRRVPGFRSLRAIYERATKRQLAGASSDAAQSCARKNSPNSLNFLADVADKEKASNGRTK